MIVAEVAERRAEPTSDSIHESSSRRPVTLRGLMLATAYFALSSALAARQGLGSFVLMNGLFLTWLSYRGYLGWMQTRRARPWTFCAGWIMFLVSFGLPAITFQGCSNGPETKYGWEAAAMTAISGVEQVDEVRKRFRDPTFRTDRDLVDSAAEIFFAVFWNTPNLLMLISPWMLYRQQRGKGSVLAWFFMMAAFSSWVWGLSGSAELRVGYYVWSGGITTLMLAYRPQKFGLVAGGFVGAGMLLLLIWS